MLLSNLSSINAFEKVLPHVKSRDELVEVQGMLLYESDTKEYYGNKITLNCECITNTSNYYSISADVSTIEQFGYEYDWEIWVTNGIGGAKAYVEYTLYLFGNAKSVGRLSVQFGDVSNL